MGQDLAEAFPPARLLFEEVDDALSQHLSRLMFEGPESDLTLTENAQPALLAASLAVIRVLEAEGGFDVARQVAYVAGHSLGEYSALAAARRRVGRRRGAARQAARPGDAKGGAGRRGRDGGAARPRYRRPRARSPRRRRAIGVCAVANDNCPGQIVVSGHRAAVERAVALAAERGARRSIMLPVSAPFHCPLMAPAAEVMAEALAEVALAAAAGAGRRQRHRRARPAIPRRSRSCWSSR